MLDALLQPSTVTRLLHLLQAAQPFLTPNWCRLADMCIRLLNISELFRGPRKPDFAGLLRDVRGCTPSDDMNSLLCAIRPFCSEEELRMLQMYEQFQQMQQMMDMWKMFSDLMPATDKTSGPFSPFDALSGLFGAGSDPKFADLFSAFMQPKSTVPPTETPPVSTPLASESHAAQDSNPFLAFLSPEQLSLYNSILSEKKGDSHES